MHMTNAYAKDNYTNQRLNMKSPKQLKSATSDDKVKVSINIPKNLLIKVDEDRRKNKMTRSTWLSLAAIERISNRDTDK